MRELKEILSPWIKHKESQILYYKDCFCDWMEFNIYNINQIEMFAFIDGGYGIEEICRLENLNNLPIEEFLIECDKLLEEQDYYICKDMIEFNKYKLLL